MRHVISTRRTLPSMSKMVDTAVGRKPVWGQMSVNDYDFKIGNANCGLSRTSASGWGDLGTGVVTIGFSTYVPRTEDYESWRKRIHRKCGLQTWGHFVLKCPDMKRLNRPKAYLGLG